MRLIDGDRAVDFAVEDLGGNFISLKDYAGKKLMLSFYRYASCPYCNLRVSRLINYYPQFHEKGLYMLAFFQSPKESILGRVGKQNAPFPIIADPERKIYRKYGVGSSWKGFFKALFRISTNVETIKKGHLPGKMEGEKALIPADFLIGPDLIIKKAYYGKDITDHLPIKEIQGFLK